MSRLPSFPLVVAFVFGAGLGASGVAVAQSCAGLAAYWKLDETYADAAAGNTLTPHGAVSFSAGRLGSGAVTIVGSASSYLQTTALASYGVSPAGFTVELWVWPGTLLASNPRLIQVLNPGATQGWELAICKNNCLAGKVLFNSQGTFFVSDAVITGGWHHVACTYDGARVSLYIDGVADASAPVSGLQTNVAGGTLTLGQNSGNYGDPFDGQIDDVRIWTVARTGADIARDMVRDVCPGTLLRMDALASVGGMAVAAGFSLGMTLGQSVTGVAASAPFIETVGFWLLAYTLAVSVEGGNSLEFPRAFYLAPAAPNPTAGRVSFRYGVPAAGSAEHLSIRIFDVTGRLVRVLQSGPQRPGHHVLTWDGSRTAGGRVGPGIYFCRMEAGRFRATRRVAFIR